MFYFGRSLLHLGLVPLGSDFKGPSFEWKALVFNNHSVEWITRHERFVCGQRYRWECRQRWNLLLWKIFL